ncbi:hypothetical protein CU044_1809 [Streptomyces sp. L-9-10]|nr:hypothetical protein CU044_1809 [Streptomyces sp. L-9-10]
MPGPKVLGAGLGSGADASGQSRRFASARFGTMAWNSQELPFHLSMTRGASGLT